MMVSSISLRIELLTEKSEADLLRIPNFGRVCLKEVKDALAARGLQLGPREIECAEPSIPAQPGSIKELKLSARAMNCLRNEGVTCIDELTEKTGGDLLRLPNFGRISLKQLAAANGSTINNFIITCLEKSIHSAGTESPEEPPCHP
jgi:DNA-directed RNA polymerase alpha subunit